MLKTNKYIGILANIKVHILLDIDFYNILFIKIILN